MKQKRFLYLICTLLIALVSIGGVEGYAAAKKKTKAKTTAVSKTSSKGTTAKAKKKTASKKKSTAAATSTKKKTTTAASKSSKTSKASKTSGKKTLAKSTVGKKKKKRTTTKAKTRKRKTTPAFTPYTPPAEPILNDSLTLLVNSEVLEWIPQNMNPGGLRVNSVIADSKTRTAKIGLTCYLCTRKVKYVLLCLVPLYDLRTGSRKQFT